jgi:hypothetical protein
MDKKSYKQYLREQNEKLKEIGQMLESAYKNLHDPNMHDYGIEQFNIALIEFKKHNRNI